MEYLLTPYSKQQEYLAWWDDAFTNDELNWLQNLAIKASVLSRVGGIPSVEGKLDDNIRRSKIDWLFCNNENQWIFHRLAHVVSFTNANIFNFDLTGFGEGLQLSNYECDNKGTYGWHTDSGGGGISRKLSLSVQLSNPTEYEGGFLEVQDPGSGKVHQIPKKRGYISIFPSYIRHQVTPVTSGSRQSLVIWISGPQFK